MIISRKLVILILQTLKHFNNVLKNVDTSYTNASYDVEGKLEKDAKSIDRKLLKEIEYQKSKLVK